MVAAAEAAAEAAAMVAAAEEAASADPLRAAAEAAAEAEAAAAAAADVTAGELMDVVCPPELGAERKLRITLPDGRQFDVVVPDSIAAGRLFRVGPFPARLSGAGGQRQRQRIGPAPHDAPPSSAAVTQMGLEEVVTALTYCNSGATAVVACCRVAELCIEEGNQQLAVEAGAFEAVVAALQAHLQAVGVQKQGCRALRNICCGTDTAGLARKQRAAETGALEAVAAAMQAHPQVVGVQEHACAVLCNLCHGTDAAALGRKQWAAEAGGPEAAAAALRAHPGDAEVQRLGQLVIDRTGDRRSW